MKIIFEQILFIDWSEGSRTINYIGAANRVPRVGTFVANYLDFLFDNGFITFNRVNVIGFSLGGDFRQLKKYSLLHDDFYSAYCGTHWQECCSWKNQLHHRTRSSRSLVQCPQPRRSFRRRRRNLCRSYSHQRANSLDCWRWNRSSDWTC